VMAFHLPAQPTSKEQLALLTWLAGRPVRRGKVMLPGGKKGTWIMARDKQQGRSVLAITWGHPRRSQIFIPSMWPCAARTIRDKRVGTPPCWVSPAGSIALNRQAFPTRKAKRNKISKIYCREIMIPTPLQSSAKINGFAY
jgi:hypothetical protein